MAVYRAVGPRLWRDQRFRALSPDEKLLTLYLLTSPQSNRIGYYYLSAAQASEDLRTQTETFLRRFQVVLETFGWEYDPEASVLLVTTWWDEPGNRPQNPKHLKGNLRDLEEVPENKLFDTFRIAIGKLCESLGESYANTYVDTFGISETEPETGTEPVRLLARGGEVRGSVG